MKKDILKVGFDLDGVILYNPIRIFRPFASALKPLVFRKSNNSFYFPRTKLEQIFWKLLHKTSFCVAPGMNLLKELIRTKKIQAYIITSRYSFLNEEFEGWMKVLNVKKHFTACYYNKTNLQPNEFKKMMIKKLKLDIFVEDNWGVVQKINHQNVTKIYWITNIFDQNIQYKYKFRNLREVLFSIRNRPDSRSDR